MSIGRTKVAIVGAGAVGSTLGYYLTSNRICNALLMIDINAKKAWAEAVDLRHSMGASGGKIDIRDGGYADCKDADIVVLTVGAPYREGMTRLDMYKKCCQIMDSVVPQIMDSGFNGIFVVVSNPVDLMTQYVQALSGLAPARVIGTGTALDSARLKVYLADLLDVDPRSVDALCMGEHGDSQMIPWSQVTIGGKPFLSILKDNPERLRGVKLDSIMSEITYIAYDVVKNKGATCYGIASATGSIIQAILFDENKVIPVSGLFTGEYGYSGIYAGIPAVICSHGIKETVTYHLTEEELAKLSKSLDVLKSHREGAEA